MKFNGGILIPILMRTLKKDFLTVNILGIDDVSKMMTTSFYLTCSGQKFMNNPHPCECPPTGERGEREY
jgi:hypothetical protein